MSIKEELLALADWLDAFDQRQHTVSFLGLCRLLAFPRFFGRARLSFDAENLLRDAVTRDTFGSDRHLFTPGDTKARAAYVRGLVDELLNAGHSD